MRIGVSAIFHGDSQGLAKHLNNFFADWAKQPSEYEYYIFVNENSSKVLYLKYTNFHIIKANKIANYPISAVIWHQLILPILVKRLSIDVLFLPITSFVILAPCPVVAMIRDLREKKISGVYSSHRMFYRNRIMNPAATGFSTHLITISQSTKKDILEFYPFARNKISVVYHGINLDPNKESDYQKVLNKFGIQSPYVLSVGRIDPLGNKNQIRLLQAFELFSRRVETPYRLVLAGPTVRTCAKGNGTLELFKFLQNYALRDYVVITGYVPEAELMTLYANAMLFIFPSLYEGFGYPLLEAMVNSCPICCSNVSSLPEIAGNAALYFDPYNVEEMASVMLKVVLGGELKKSLIGNGISRVKKFSWETEGKKIFNILKKAASKRGEHQWK